MSSEPVSNKRLWLTGNWKIKISRNFLIWSRVNKMRVVF